MKYMLLMHAPRAGWQDAGIGTWPPADLKAHIQFMHDFNKRLKADGNFVDALGLDMPQEARVVRATTDGSPAVTDGPFAEAKEFLAGFWVIDVASTEQAYEIAARASAAPGRGGLPMSRGHRLAADPRALQPAQANGGQPHGVAELTQSPPPWCKGLRPGWSYWNHWMSTSAWPVTIGSTPSARICRN